VDRRALQARENKGLLLRASRACVAVHAEVIMMPLGAAGRWIAAPYRLAKIRVYCCEQAGLRGSPC